MAASACIGRAAVMCDRAEFAASADSATTYASVPAQVPVGHVVHSQCDDASPANQQRRFGLGTINETIKCTAQGRRGLLNLPPTGCASTIRCAVGVLLLSAVQLTRLRCDLTLPLL